MNGKWFLIAAMVLVLCSLAALPISAQGPMDPESLWQHLGEAGSSQAERCIPERGYCQYYTYLDNEDNNGTGNPDNDMGCTDLGCRDTYNTCESDDQHPIELRIVVSTITYDTDAAVLLGANEPASLSQIARIEFNGIKWEVEDETRHSDLGVVTWAGHVDPALIQADGNLVKVYLRSGECLRLFNVWMMMTDWPWDFEEEFVPEPAPIVLLGSGLATLAGYGALRWRTRA